jgi:predicted benzoate:H+ symporter BenE
MDEIERLELRIDELREAIERSRRWRFAGRASAVLGPALLAGLMLGIVDYTPERVIAALALAIGGMVLMGSSRSSTEELERALKHAEAERMAAIDALDLVQVGDAKSSLRGA